MTPEEQHYMHFFNMEMSEISQLDDLGLRARREELVEWIKEGKVRFSAVDKEERRRKAETGKSTGFSRSVESDEISTDAINKVKARSKKLTEMEKVIAGLMKIPGMDRTTAERLASARTAKEHRDDKVKKDNLGKDENLKDTKVTQTAFSFVNPFAKKEEPKIVATEVTITEDVVVIQTEEKKPTLNFVNPFEKK